MNRTRRWKSPNAPGAEVTLYVEGAGHGGGEFFAGDRPKKLLDFLNGHLLPAKERG